MVKTLKDEHNIRYDITCPHCGKKLWACRSLGMLVGWIDTGFGKCTSCDMHFELVYDPKANTLVAMDGEHSKKLNEMQSDEEVKQ